MILVTSLCWWLYDGDWFQMLVAESFCWRLFLLCWRFSQCIKSVTNILNRSPTSQTCHHHVWSQTSVTNIDVTVDHGDRFLTMRYRQYRINTADSVTNIMILQPASCKEGDNPRILFTCLMSVLTKHNYVFFYLTSIRPDALFMTLRIFSNRKRSV